VRGVKVNAAVGIDAGRISGACRGCLAPTLSNERPAWCQDWRRDTKLIYSTTFATTRKPEIANMAQ
jgi:hypothetical protein